MANTKDLKPLIKALEKQGWRVRYGKHIVLYPPNSKMVITVSKSPKSGSTAKIIKQCRSAGADL